MQNFNLEEITEKYLLQTKSKKDDCYDPNDHKRLTAYNIFLEEQMKILEKEQITPQNKMVKIGHLWKQLDNKKKSTYKRKAANHNKKLERLNTIGSYSTTRGPTGYNLFVKIQRGKIKNDFTLSKSSNHNSTKSNMITSNNNNLYASQIMNEIVKSWAQLNQEEKMQWNSQAEHINYYCYL